MEIQFLGTAGYHPNESRHTACLLLPDAGIVLDAGTGFFRVRDRLRAPGLAILLSHLHLDHTAGLTCLPDVLWGRAVESVCIYGPPGVEYLQHGLFASPLFPLELEFPVLEAPAGGVEIAGARVTTRYLLHPGGSLAYRLDWPDCSLAYVTDTSASLDYAGFVAGVDLLVHECNFPDRQADLARRTGHSWTSAVAELALAAEAKRLGPCSCSTLMRAARAYRTDRAPTSSWPQLACPLSTRGSWLIMRCVSGRQESRCCTRQSRGLRASCASCAFPQSSGPTARRPWVRSIQTATAGRRTASQPRHCAPYSPGNLASVIIRTRQAAVKGLVNARHAPAW